MAYVHYVQFALAIGRADLLDHNMEFFTAMRGPARDEAPIRQRSLHDVRTSIHPLALCGDGDSGVPLHVQSPMILYHWD